MQRKLPTEFLNHCQKHETRRRTETKDEDKQGSRKLTQQTFERHKNLAHKTEYAKQKQMKAKARGALAGMLTSYLSVCVSIFLCMCVCSVLISVYVCDNLCNDAEGVAYEFLTTKSMLRKF